MPVWLQVVAAIAQVVIAGGAVWGVWVAIRSSRETKRAIDDFNNMVEIERKRDEERRAEQKRAALSAHIEHVSQVWWGKPPQFFSFIAISNEGPGPARDVAVTTDHLDTEKGIHIDVRTFAIGVIGSGSSFRWRSERVGRLRVRLTWRDDDGGNHEYETELLTTDEAGKLGL